MLVMKSFPKLPNHIKISFPSPTGDYYTLAINIFLKVSVISEQGVATQGLDCIVWELFPAKLTSC